LTHLSYIELSREALLHNARVLKEFAPSTWFTAVVKANAYGHGLDEVVTALEEHVDALQVDDLEELRHLRRLTDKWALVYGYIALSQLEEACRLNAEVVVYDLDQIVRLAEIKPDEEGAGLVNFSLKIDALLGRQGILPSEIDDFLDELAKYPHLEPTSAYAHYANIEDTTDLTHAEAQEAAFEEAYAKIAARYLHLGKHISATSGVLTREPERSAAGMYNSMIRLGIGLYGLYPSAPLARSHAHLNLQPVMRWITHLAQVKTLPAGHPVGYGLTYRTTRPTTIGIVPQGYSDGYDRGLSNVGEVLVHGRRCPVIGRIAMNMFAIDLTPAPDARAEDEVVLLGRQGDDRITAEEIAQKLGTINYEVVARISPLLPRVVED
jgi:alanine racemase